MDEQWKRGLEIIHGATNGLRGHPLEFNKIASWLAGMIRVAGRVGDPGEVEDRLLQLGASEDDAHDIRVIYETLEVLETEKRYYDADFVAQRLAEVGTRGR